MADRTRTFASSQQRGQAIQGALAGFLTGRAQRQEEQQRNITNVLTAAKLAESLGAPQTAAGLLGRAGFAVAPEDLPNIRADKPKFGLAEAFAFQSIPDDQKADVLTKILSGEQQQKIAAKVVEKAMLGPLETAQKVEEQKALLPGEVEASEQKAEATVVGKSVGEAETGAQKMSPIVDLYNKSLQEIEQEAPSAMEKGVKGKVFRAILKPLVKGEVIEGFTNTKTFIDNVGVLVTQAAKSAGQDRISDLDFERFIDSVVNPLGKSAEANVSNFEFQIKQLEAAGADPNTIDQLNQLIEVAKTRVQQAQSNEPGEDQLMNLLNKFKGA